MPGALLRTAPEALESQALVGLSNWKGSRRAALEVTPRCCCSEKVLALRFFTRTADYSARCWRSSIHSKSTRMSPLKKSMNKTPTQCNRTRQSWRNATANHPKLFTPVTFRAIAHRSASSTKGSHKSQVNQESPKSFISPKQESRGGGSHQIPLRCSQANTLGP